MFNWLKRLLRPKRSAAGGEFGLRQLGSPEAPVGPGSTPPSSNDRDLVLSEETSRRTAAAAVMGSAESDRETIYIGLDWGTHSTKIVIRRGMDETGELLPVLPEPSGKTYDHDADGPYPWFAVPSVVGVQDGRLVCGDAARALPMERKHYALKATMLMGRPALSESVLAEVAPFDRLRTVDLLATAYLCWVLGHVRSCLDERIGRGRWRPFVSMGTPTDRTGDAELQRRYERMLNAAWNATFLGGELSAGGDPELLPLFARLEEFMTLPLPADGEKPFAVLPETLAGLVPITREPRREDGIYNVIDIGGGSTEVSISQLSDSGQGVINCVADKSIPTGALDLRAEGGASRGEPLARIRATLKEQWVTAYLAECRNRLRVDAWAKNIVLKAGGGWGSGRVESDLSDHHPARIYYSHRRDSAANLRFVLYTPSPDLLAITPSAHVSASHSRAQFHFLPVALGLSLYPMWPRWYPPQDATPVEADARDLLEPDATHGHS